jgi:regulator of nonsense transcripts 1
MMLMYVCMYVYLFVYHSTLQNGVSDFERILPGVDLPFPDPNHPMFFLCSSGSEEIGPSGTSFLNRTEAACGK